MRLLRAMRPAVLPGERRVWIAAAIVALPFVALIAYECLRSRDYVTGTNSVEVYTYVAPTPHGVAMCVPGLQIPPGTRRLQLHVLSRTSERPAMGLKLRTAGAPREVVASELPAAGAGRDRASDPIFALPLR